MQTVTLDGTIYAADLWWQVREGGAVSHKVMLGIAIETAEKYPESGYTCVAIRKEQYGLGVFQPPVPRLPSLAAALRVSKTLLGIFALENPLNSEPLWWIVGISSGLVAAEGDAVCSTQDEAQEYLDRMLRILFNDEQEIVICTTPEESLKFLLPLISSEAKVESLYVDSEKRRKRIQLILAGTAILVMTTCGVLFWNAWQERTLQEAVQRAFQSKEAHKATILNNRDAYFEKRWLTAPLASIQARACLEQMLTTPIAANGWIVDTLVCQGTALTEHWSHRPGGDYMNPPRLNALLDEKTPRLMTSRRPIMLLARGRQEVPLFQRTEVSRRLYQITQAASARIRLGWSPPEKKTIEEVELVALWQKGTWEISELPASAILDSGLFLSLETLPGLTLDQITRDKARWKLRGTIHARTN